MLIILSVALRGGCNMTSLSTGSTPRLHVVKTERRRIERDRGYTQYNESAVNMYEDLPLSRWTIHNDIDPEYLHGIQRVG